MTFASWESSTGAGDDVLEVTDGAHGSGVTVTRVTAADLRRIADAGELEDRFGAAASTVAMALHLYRLSHEPALARAAEDAVREQLAQRRAEDARLAELRRSLGVTE